MYIETTVFWESFRVFGKGRYTFTKAKRRIENMATMKEAIVDKGPSIKIVDSPIPEPGPEQVVIKVEVSGSNPKDW